MQQGCNRNIHEMSRKYTYNSMKITPTKHRWKSTVESPNAAVSGKIHLKRKHNKEKPKHCICTQSCRVMAQQAFFRKNVCGGRRSETSCKKHMITCIKYRWGNKERTSGRSSNLGINAQILSRVHWKIKGYMHVVHTGTCHTV
jgi:hypothetical protein